MFNQQISNLEVFQQIANLVFNQQISNLEFNQQIAGCDISSRSANCQGILTSVREFCKFSQKSGKHQGILKRQVYELQKISRIVSKAFPSSLDFTIIE